MGIQIPVEATLDVRSATAAANRAERVFADAGRDAGKAFTSGFKVDGVEQDLKKIGEKASDSYDKARDAAGRLRAEEEKLQTIREKGARNDQVVAQAERVEKARRAEIRAIRDATNAYEEYERAAESAGQQSGDSFTSGLSGARAGASAAGSGWADSFAGGFAGSSSLGNLPTGLLKGAGWVTAGIRVGKLFGGAIADGMATIQMQDVLQAKMGLDESSMAQYASAAGAAYANNWGASVADNLSTAQVALQSGIIDTTATGAEVQAVIEQLQGMATVTDATTAELSRSITTMMRTGMADSVSEASDIIVAGFQGGLDVSGDWLDTINEYSTQFRKLGLDSGQVLTLLSQGMKGGARDTDKVADSLKEFSIRAVDGSKATREGFEALGFNADEMASMFAKGGDSAEVALGAVLAALKNIDDPMQQALIWPQLFGTPFEDMGDAINKFDLSPTAREFTDLAGVSDRSTKTATENFKSDWEAAQRSVEQGFADLRKSMADWFTDLPFIKDLPKMLKDAADAIRGVSPYAPATVWDVPGTPLSPLDLAAGGTAGWWRDGISTPAAPSVPGAPSGPLPAMGPLGEILLPSTTGPSAGQGPGVTAPVPGARTPILTDAQAEAAKEAEKAAKGGGASLPAAPVLPMQYTSTAGMPSNLASNQARIDELRHSLAEKQARVQQLESGNLGTAEDNQKARNDVVKAEQDLAQAERSMHDTRIKGLESQTKQLGQVNSAMGEIGAALDSDLGISKGLPGIAENLVRFVASLAAAPLVGQLSAISNAHGDEGSGLMGILGSTGALGPRFMPGATGSGGSSSVSSSGGYSGGGVYPGDAALLANVPVGRYTQTAGADLTQGLADCSSSVEDLVNIIDGRPTGGRSMSTGNADEWLASRGFVPGMGGLGDFRVGYNSGHMQATLPGGTPFNWGSDASAANRGIGGTGADDPSFTDHWFRPGGAGAGGGGPVTASLSPSGGGVTSVFVVNMPGGGISATTPSAPSAPSAPRTPSAPSAPSAPTTPSATPTPSASATPPVSTSPWSDGTVGSNPVAPDAVRADYSSPFVPVGGAPLPALGSMPGGGGGGPGMGMPNGLMGGGAPGGMGGGMGGGGAYPAQGGEGGIGVGGMAMDGIMAAASGLDMMAPGAGAAAKIGIQLANRTAKYAGQVAGIATSGVMETLSLGDNPMGSIGSSWFGKLAGGLAGARPATPNAAGKAGAPPNPNGEGGQQGGAGGVTNNINVKNEKATEDYTGGDIASHMSAAQSQPGRQ